MYVGKMIMGGNLIDCGFMIVNSGGLIGEISSMVVVVVYVGVMWLVDKLI